MTIAQAILPEFDQEMATTRVMLARVPEDRAGWRPHPKSWTLGDLVSHLANLPAWGVYTLREDAIDLHPPGGAPMPSPRYGGRDDNLATFDRHVAEARALLAAASDADFAKPWSLKRGGAVLLTLPRVVCIRSFVLNHMVHHRGQLSVYLRLNDVPLPPVYGPTADEGQA